ncbi:MAG: ribonuclease J [Thiohalocapsa sp.]|jgi:ribonuclease J
MTPLPADTTPRADEVLFLPLGGTGEIGMNLNLYGHDGHWLIIDVGITFGGDAFPDYDVLMADPAFIVSRRQRLAGIVLTHAHEDHVGAVAYLWKRLKCPVYATPFTAAIARFKLARAGLDDVPVHELPLGARFEVGPFGVEYIGMTHSIPEPNAVLITTPAGAVFHTGDWKLDDGPVIGSRYDALRLRALRREPLLAMVCDSTNAVVAGSTGSESGLFQPLKDVVEAASGRVVVTSFASNVARLVTLACVAEATGRRFGVIGQAMERMVAVARSTGYWPLDLPELVDARHLGYLPREEVLAVCTGSQGEPRSALSRMAADSHRDILLDPGDTVIFSSKLIPGNERPVQRVQSQLRALGCELVTDADAHVHVSGHPAADDLRRLYDWVQPPAVVPTHGTPRHLRANADIALSCHVPRVAVIENGDVCRLGSDGPSVVGQVATGRLTLDADGRLAPVAPSVLADMRATVG